MRPVCILQFKVLGKPKFKAAHMGEESKMYYHPEVRLWSRCDQHACASRWDSSKQACTPASYSLAVEALGRTRPRGRGCKGGSRRDGPSSHVGQLQYGSSRAEVSMIASISLPLLYFLSFAAFPTMHACMRLQEGRRCSLRNAERPCD